LKKEFSKLIVAWLIFHATVWVYLTYALAFMNKIKIAETLSKTIVVEILTVTLIYALKSLFENLSKNNTWPDKPMCKEIEDEKPAEVNPL